MPITRFFFDLDDGSDVFRDEEGSEISSSADLRREAVLSLIDVLRSKSMEQDHVVTKVHVRDGNGRAVLTADLTLTCQDLIGGPAA